jgi:hypothetical protein
MKETRQTLNKRGEVENREFNVRRQPKRGYQPGREDMKRALRHIDKLAKMAQKLPGYDTNIALQLNVGKSLRFLEIYSARMEDPLI